MFYLRIAALVSLAALAGSSQTHTAARPVNNKPASVKSRSAGLNDAELENAIRARFAKSKIGKNGFQVRVQGGTATLEGQTDVIQHKATATRLAKNAGAVRVVNRIRISEAARQKAAAHLAQGRRRAQIKRSEPRSEEVSPK